MNAEQTQIGHPIMLNAHGACSDRVKGLPV